MLKDFKVFIMRGSVVDLAVGVITRRGHKGLPVPRNADTSRRHAIPTLHLTTLAMAIRLTVVLVLAAGCVARGTAAQTPTPNTAFTGNLGYLNTTGPSSTGALSPTRRPLL
jgi:hypothetical protein